MNPNSVDILLVEDNPSDAELTIREFRRQQMANNLLHVKNGEEALEFMFASGQFANTRSVQHSPKIVLLDIMMPKVNGIEVLQKLKADERTRSVPVVILTSSKERPDIQKCYGLGANSYIVKPVNYDEFAEVIRQIGSYWLLINQPSA